jgi:catechol 2,3-dioxygenase-like lactoylglutathione lyase family enzyme
VSLRRSPDEATQPDVTLGDTVEVMAIAEFKDLCIDTTGGDTLARFWASALGLDFEADERGDRVVGTLTGPTPQHTVWMNLVPEHKTAKHRVHLDVHTDSVDTLVGLGATVAEERDGWTVMTDPEDGELCAFVRDRLPGYRLYEVVVDCERPAPVARWWSDVLGAPLHSHPEHDWWWLEPVPGAPFDCMVFVPVPEPKTVKNRIHWDVVCPDVQVLLDHGAQMLRPEGGDISWHVLGDPEGNEFCAFTAEPGGPPP